MTKIYRVLDFDTEDTHHGIHVATMKEAETISKYMTDPKIDCLEINNDTQSIINALNVAAGHPLEFNMVTDRIEPIIKTGENYA
jgi:hypothetical protein